MPTDVDISPEDQGRLLNTQLESISQIEDHLLDQSKFSPQLRQSLNMSNMKQSVARTPVIPAMRFSPPSRQAHPLNQAQMSRSSKDFNAASAKQLNRILIKNSEKPN